MKITRIFIISNLFCLLQFGVYVLCELTDIVQTDKGPVQGLILQTVRKSVKFSSFRGIRYGKAPIGNLRFQPPEEADTWTETFNATNEGIPCPQIDSNTQSIIGDEDCLNLNIYTPKTSFSRGNDESLLPVMVWIYGGTFKTGSTNMTMSGPDFLIENDVVVVAMNYRLGALGFLSLNSPNATGNAGLKDQLLALNWVKENVKFFGGDPNSVTIFGISAGGASVDYHILSDKSTGLFHRSISMSASPLCDWAFFTTSEAESQAFRFGRELKINTNDKNELLSALYEVSAEKLVKIAENLARSLPLFKPTVEDENMASDKAFLTDCPINKYKSGDFNQLPHITGFMASENLFLFSDQDAFDEMIITGVDLINNISTSSNLTNYFPQFKRNADHRAIDELTDDERKEIIAEGSDIFFIGGIDLKQQMFANYSSSPVFYYRNSFAPDASLHKLLYSINTTGAAHGDDSAYIWYISNLDLPTDPKDSFVIMRDRITRMWTNFAKYSNPTPLGINDTLLNINWPDSGTAGIYLKIDKKFSLNKRPINEGTMIFEEDTKATLLNQCK